MDVVEVLVEIVARPECPIASLSFALVVATIFVDCFDMPIHRSSERETSKADWARELRLGVVDARAVDLHVLDFLEHFEADFARSIGLVAFVVAAGCVLLELVAVTERFPTARGFTLEIANILVHAFDVSVQGSLKGKRSRALITAEGLFRVNSLNVKQQVSSLLENFRRLTRNASSFPLIVFDFVLVVILEHVSVQSFLCRE